MKVIKLRYDVSMMVDITPKDNHFTSVLVEIRSDNAYDDGILLTATEARRLATALEAHADLADKKNGKISGKP